MAETLDDADDSAIDAYTEAIAALYEAATELGVLAEDIFKTAAAALFEPLMQTLVSIGETEQRCERLQYEIHQQSLTMVSTWGADDERLRDIVTLQRVSLGFVRIARDGHQIAEQALALRGRADSLLPHDEDGESLLLKLIRQTYVEVRGGVLAVTLRDEVMAQRVVAEDATLDALFLHFKSMLNQAIFTYPRNATPWQRLLLVGASMESIGNRVVNICRALA